jgi:dTDP-glucose pyrophosphorylase
MLTQAFLYKNMNIVTFHILNEVRFLNDYRKILVPPTASINETLKIIDVGSLQIALVVDKQNKLLGTVTDGDVRRGILKGISLDQPVPLVMNPDPVTVSPTMDPKQILNLMKTKKLQQLPVVDKDGCVIGLKHLNTIIQPPNRDNIVVLMAGGLGTRLRPLTNDCPKPLLKIGNKPILETILESLIEHGFNRFYLSVNYKSEMIEDYFKDGSNWGVDIHYIHEDQRMGTAGSLGLIPEKPEKPFLVMNGDILTKVNFQYLLDYHEKHKGQATLCVREYDFQVPYGVVNVDKHRLLSIEEKPKYRFFVSAGIYIFEPSVLEIIPKNNYFDMPDLFRNLLEKRKDVSIFPIREYWLDIGRIDDFERAKGEFDQEFS